MSHPLYLIAGLGKTGLSIARYLHKKKKTFIAFDTREEGPDFMAFYKEFPHITVYLEQLPTEIVTQLTDIITSPGFPTDNPFLVQAAKQGVEIYGDIECLARECKAPMVAITGTNGKSTVTTLVGEMAKAAGFSVAVAGNIGTPVLDLLDDENHYDLWVLELSSFQLDLSSSLSPSVATILNVTPDHLDRHHTVESYVQAKQRIYHHAKIAIYNREDPYTLPSSAIPCVSFGKDEPLEGNWGLRQQNNIVYLAKGQNCFLPVGSLLIKGVHNWLNALAAAALAEAVGIPLTSIIQVLTAFRGLTHRCQWIRSVEGVEWINDSKGTNVGATIAAIHGIGSALQGRIILIAGGQGKDADFKELAPATKDFVRSIVLIGQDADKIEAALTSIVPIEKASSLEVAVGRAKVWAQPGDVVLLSPACASLDMFRDFNHRGEAFVSLVLGL